MGGIFVTHYEPEGGADIDRSRGSASPTSPSIGKNEMTIMVG